MQELIDLYEQEITATLSLPLAIVISVFITFTTVLGIVHDKHMDKTATHESPIAARHLLKRAKREYEAKVLTL